MNANHARLTELFEIQRNKFKDKRFGESMNKVYDDPTFECLKNEIRIYFDKTLTSKYVMKGVKLGILLPYWDVCIIMPRYECTLFDLI